METEQLYYLEAYIGGRWQRYPEPGTKSETDHAMKLAKEKYPHIEVRRVPRE